MGKLRPAPAGYAVQKDAPTGLWYIEQRERDERGRVVNIQAIRDDDGLVMFYARRAGAITDAILHAQAMENQRLRRRLAILEGQHPNGSTQERLLGVS